MYQCDILPGYVGILPPDLSLDCKYPGNAPFRPFRRVIYRDLSLLEEITGIYRSQIADSITADSNLVPTATDAVRRPPLNSANLEYLPISRGSAKSVVGVIFLRFPGPFRRISQTTAKTERLLSDVAFCLLFSSTSTSTSPPPPPPTRISSSRNLLCSGKL